MILKNTFLMIVASGLLFSIDASAGKADSDACPCATDIQNEIASLACDDSKFSNFSKEKGLLYFYAGWENETQGRCYRWLNDYAKQGVNKLTSTDCTPSTSTFTVCSAPMENRAQMRDCQQLAKVVEEELASLPSCT